MKFITLLLFLSSFAMPVNAAKVEEVIPLNKAYAEARDSLNRSINKLSELFGFQCVFEQTITHLDGGLQQFSGSLAIRKPKRFRWQYKQPYEQLYIGDGQDIWHYEPDLMQAERLSELEAVDPLVMQLLDARLSADDIQLLQHEDVKKENIRRYLIRVDDRPPLWLEFKNNQMLQAIEREDALGNRNRVGLSECSYIAPDENLFSFAPSEDVEVLDLRSNSINRKGS